jgi:rod shape-determining protein MreC
VQIALQQSVDFFSHELNHYIFLKNMFKKYHKLKGEHKILKYENYRLRKQLATLKFKQRVSEIGPGFIDAELISVDRNFPFDCILINKGSLQGVKKNMVVLNEEGELVGRVIDPISLLSSRIRLITSPIGGVGVYMDSNRLEGLLTGSNGRICHFKYLLENVPVQVGDTVSTSGTDQIFPPDLPVGKVVGLNKEYLTQDISVMPYFVERSIKRLILVNISNRQEMDGEP